MKKIISLLVIFLLLSNFSWAKSGIGPYPKEKQIFIPVELKDGTWAYINSVGEIILRPNARPRSLTNFSEGIAIAWIPYKTFLIDTTGKTVVDPEPPFEQVYFFSDGLAAFKSKASDKWGFINKTGKIVIPAELEAPGNFSGGLAAICNNIQTRGTLRFTPPGGPEFECRFIDKTGKTVINHAYNPENFSEGFARITADKCEMGLGQCRFGFIDQTGKMRIEPKYQWANSFSEGLAAVTESNHCGYINPKGETVIDFKFIGCGDFHEGMATVESLETKKYGYVDSTGKLVIDYQFDDALPFSENLAAVELKSKNDYGHWGFIDREGKFVLQPNYSIGDGGYFSGGVSKVIQYEPRILKTDGNEQQEPFMVFQGYIDKEGNRVLVKE